MNLTAQVPAPETVKTKEKKKIPTSFAFTAYGVFETKESGEKRFQAARIFINADGHVSGFDPWPQSEPYQENAHDSLLKLLSQDGIK